MDWLLKVERAHLADFMNVSVYHHDGLDDLQCVFQSLCSACHRHQLSQTSGFAFAGSIVLSTKSHCVLYATSKAALLGIPLASRKRPFALAICQIWYQRSDIFVSCGRDDLKDVAWKKERRDRK